MSCTMALSKSPVFSPSSSLFRNKGSVVVPPPAEAISSTVTHLKSTLSPSSSSPSSPRSPFRLRLQKPPIGLTSSSGSGSSVAAASVLKRKRPARLDIPVATLGFGGPATLAVEEVEMEREGVGYSVFCKRGKREAMEDRFAADVDFQGNSKLVYYSISITNFKMWTGIFILAYYWVF
uniref:Protein phosphatase 2c n=1 Tax=Rhizophora mucronata TaxID=61149 RepID=A0A2P2IKI7_RHIMU